MPAGGPTSTEPSPRLRPAAGALVGGAIVVGCSLFVLWQLAPGRVLLDTTPIGGDLTAHVWGPAFLRDHLLPNGRLSGWSTDWFAGFPAYHSYFVLPALLVVGIDVALPYNVAFKLIVVAGSVALPPACYMLGRALGLRRPAPALLAVAAVAVLCNDEPVAENTGNIIGGNLGSTLAGEFSYSLSLALAVFAAASAVRLVRTGRGRALTAALLAATGLCHVVPVVLALTAAGLAVVVYGRRRAAARDMVISVAVAGAVGAFWALPFLARRHLVGNPGFERLDGDGLFTAIAPPAVRWILGLALVGAVVSTARRASGGLFLGALAASSLAAVVLLPASALWNARFLAPWYLTAGMLAALGVAELGHAIAELFRRPGVRRMIGDCVAPAALALVVLTNAGLHLGALPGLSHRADGGVRWLGIDVGPSEMSPYRFWAESAFGGFERMPWWSDVQAFVAAVDRVVRSGGCGRVLVEESAQELEAYSALAPHLLPYWTDGCVAVVDGLWAESSTTHPAVNDVVVDLQSGQPRRGVAGLRMLAVRWYVASSAPIVASLREQPGVTDVARSGTWHVFEIEGAELVTPLEVEPVVVNEGAARTEGWQYVDANRPLRVTAGPPSWARVGAAGTAPRRHLPGVSVGAVESSDGRLEFDVSRPGVPVLVRMSWFPGWRAHGAAGPWRAAPNLMVVVPTAKHVVLTFERTSLDVIAHVGSGAGLLALVALVSLDRRRSPGPVALRERHRDHDHERRHDGRVRVQHQGLPVGPSGQPGPEGPPQQRRSRHGDEVTRRGQHRHLDPHVRRLTPAPAPEQPDRE